MDGSTAKDLLIPLGLAITTVISGWAINQLPAVDQSRAKVILTIKLAIETLIFAIFISSLENVFKILQNTNAERSVKTLALAFIAILLLFSIQIVYDLFQLSQPNFNSKNIVNPDKEDEKDKERHASARRNKIKQTSALLNQKPEDLDLKAINLDLKQLGITPEHRKRASKWLEIRANDWINNLQMSNYRSYGVTNRNSGEFCDDLKQHIRLLQKNIEDGIGRTPRKSREKVDQRVGSPVPYKFALMDIQTLINQELEEDEKAREWLKEEGIQALQRYTQRLIDSIDQ